MKYIVLDCLPFTKYCAGYSDFLQKPKQLCTIFSSIIHLLAYLSILTACLVLKVELFKKFNT